MSGNVAKRCEVSKEVAKEWLTRECAKWIGLGCPYCGKTITVFNFSIDHVVPISRGGQRGTGNIQLTCKTCNLTKGDFSDEEYRRILDFATTGGDEFKKHLLGKLRMGGIIFNRGRRRYAKAYAKT